MDIEIEQDDKDAREREAERLGKKRKIDNFGPAYIRKPITNSTSLLKLQHKVLRGVMKLLRAAYTQELLRLQDTKCSSALMRSADARLTGGKGIPLIANLTPDKSLIRVTRADTKEKGL